MLLCAALLQTGCPNDDTPASTGSTPPPLAPETTPELRARAQAAALERLRPLAATALRLDDPAFASRWSDTPPSLPPTDAAAREALRAALNPAREEATGLRPQLLPAQDRVVALVTRFGLNRSQDRVFRQRPSRTDPGWILSELEHLLDVLEMDTRRSGSCPRCATAIATLPAALTQARADLGATSAPVLAAAQTDAAALGARLAALPLDASTTGPATEALEGYARSLADIALPKQPNATYAAKVSPASGPTSVLRLPDRLDAPALSRRLEVEENVSASPSALFTSLGRTVSQLSALRAAHPIDAAAAPAPLTEARCAAAWAPLAAFAGQSPAVAAGDFSCEAFAAGWGGAPLDDTALSLKLIDVALIETHRRAQLTRTAEVLRAVPGRLSPVSQQHTMRTAIAIGSKSPASGAAIAGEHDAACLAATAVWIHGEVGDDKALASRLATHCPSKTPQAWMDAAEARPRSALGGLGLARVADGPAGLVSLDRYWWAPLGFVDLLSDPEHQSSAPAATVNMKVEPVQPGPNAPPVDSPTDPPAGAQP